MKTPRSSLKYLLAVTLVIAVLSSSPGRPLVILEIPSLYGVKQWVASWFGTTNNDRIFPTVEAAQDYITSVNGGPTSTKHKDFDGGWIMPFEIYDVSNGTPDQYGNIGPSGPVWVDLNGDGLLDLMYSSGQTAGTSGGSFTGGGVLQYILLRKGNQYELVYQCQQTYASGGSRARESFTYRGDCADTSFTGSIATPSPWTPAAFILDNQIIPEFASYNTPAPSGASYGPASIDLDIFQKYQSTCKDGQYINLPGGYSIRCYKYLPRLMDMNGDGLVDVVMRNGRYDEPTQGRGPNYQPIWYQRIDFILYNNGHGFEPGLLCAQYSAHYPSPYYTVPNHYGQPNTGSRCRAS